MTTAISALARLDALERVMLSETGLSEFGPLRGLARLQSVSLDESRSVTDLTPLRSLPELRRISLPSGRIVDGFDEAEVEENKTAVAHYLASPP